MSKKAVCDLCGLPDNSYSIEDGGSVFKVCKFCHDGFLEKQGIDPQADNSAGDLILQLDLESELGASEVQEQLNHRVVTLSPEELDKILKKGQPRQQRQNGTPKNKSEEIIMSMEAEERKKRELKERLRAEQREKLRLDRLMKDVNPHSDDERISITSPEIPLYTDKRLKTNLDVAVNDLQRDIRFLDAFKYVFHRIIYCVFIGVIVLGIFTAQMIVLTYREALINLAGGTGAVILGFLLMWYMSARLGLDRRALLLRIRQEEILFASMNSACYRELRTKYTILRALGWLLNKLSVLLPLLAIVACVLASVILCFITEYWWMFAPILASAMIAGIIVYWLVKFAADIVAYKLDAERNQQIAQQTMLDILDVLKKNK